MQSTMACSKEEREKGAWAEDIHFDFTFTSAMLSLTCSSFITFTIGEFRELRELQVS